ncbi:hypothetical protein [Comamonas sp. MYb69]|uniref:hypothetical protein n=1 Tax=Comamonas sp. MYb69 TaxID=1848650 RepID=UPI0030B0481B
MYTTELAVLLETAPEQHSRRCALALNAIHSGRWPAAGCGLRAAAVMVQAWADQARSLADWCDTQVESGRVHSTLDTTLKTDASDLALELVSQPTAEALEAGLMALAHFLGREHAMRVRRAMNGTLLAATPLAATLSVDAHAIGAALDQHSLEQADAA